MRLPLVALVMVLGFCTPSTILACSCRMAVPTGRATPQRPWSTDRARIFIGHVLEVDATPMQPTRMTVRFVTESSWRGPMPDTVTLLIKSDAPCAHYSAGGRYVVFADVDDASRSRLVTAQCDYSWAVRHSSRILADLGPPDWNAPHMGSRALDARAIRLGEPIGRIPASADTLTFSVPNEEGMDRFEIGDWAGPPTPHGRLLHLAPGLYQFRVRWKDGTVYESYLSLRCEERISERRCHTFRFFGGLRPT